MLMAALVSTEVAAMCLLPTEAREDKRGPLKTRQESLMRYRNYSQYSMVKLERRYRAVKKQEKHSQWPLLWELKHMSVPFRVTS